MAEVNVEMQFRAISSHNFNCWSQFPASSKRVSYTCLSVCPNTKGLSGYGAATYLIGKIKSTVIPYGLANKLNVMETVGLLSNLTRNSPEVGKEEL